MTLCPCDTWLFPRPSDIPPGLARLPRQLGLFGDFRAAMLASVREHGALRDWRARDSEDFGLMLLDWWAVVSDVTAFYTAEHAQDLYLGTARDEARLRALAALIGYRPRPALAAQALLAALVEGDGPVTAPAGARFIADAVDDAPPQEFELDVDTVIEPLRNRWTLAPVPGTAWDAANLLIDPASRNLAEEGLLVVEAAGASSVHRVASVKPETALDGASYLRVSVADPSALPAGPARLDQVRLWSFTQSAPLLLAGGNIAQIAGVQPQLRVGETVVVEDTAADAPAAPVLRSVLAVGFGKAAMPPALDTGTIGDMGPDDAPPEPEPIETVTTHVLLSGTVSVPAARARLHFGRVRAGRPVAPALTQIASDRIATGPALAGRHDAPQTEGDGTLFLKGALARGVHLPGEVSIGADGAGRLLPSGSFQPFEGSLRTPVEVFGNVLRVSRGRSVDEVLGSGAGPAQPFQSFTLAKFPLTYIADPLAPGGRRSTLEITVDGARWREVESLFLAGPEDRVYTVDLDARGKATVTFGDGVTGRAPPEGRENIRARYRHGAGEPPPAAGTIRQVAGPVPGLRRVFNPVAAFGGGPGDRPEDIRWNAAASAATLDRAVSAEDFAALARDAGALAAVAATEWVPERLREGVVVVAILSGEATPEALASLSAHLAARAAEALPIRVVPAQAKAGVMRLTYSPDPEADPATLADAVEAALFDPFTGFLAPRRAAIGGPVFRSAILGRVAAVPGMGRLLALSLGAGAMPLRVPLEPQEYFAPELVLEEVTP
jgi:hypothetical protein